MTKLFAVDAMYMHEQMGTAGDPDGLKYKLQVGFPGHLPIIVSEQTGIACAISWPDLIDLAVKAGVDDPANITHNRKVKVR